MREDIKISKSLDLKGLACPMPIVKISKGIKEVAIGEIIEALATDPGALTDVPAWSRTTGHEIIQTDHQGDVIRFLIKRTS